MLFLLMINVLQSCLLISQAFNYNYYIGRINAFVTQLLMLFVALLNIQILSVFAILNEDITKGRLKALRIIVVTVYLVMALATFLKLFYGPMFPRWMQAYNSIGLLGFAIFTICYDNIQAIGLTYLVYNFKKSKRGKVTDKSLESMKSMVTTNIAIIIFDWIGIIGCALSLYLPVIVENYQLATFFFSMLEINAGFHSTFIILVLAKLKDFAFEDKPEKFTWRTLVQRKK
ncbi:hypothetical protein HDV01_003654 [Terramyces sp. JEL0728]|nr:hypothetical protein HDV01_003654 [Terramyces sp. JEL0728]